MEIIELSQRPELMERGVDYFWRQWGNAQNFDFYSDCIRHSLNPENPLPKFYLALEDSAIIGSYALLVNDINSRQDLVPWFACLYVAPEWRGRRVGFDLQEHGIQEAGRKGFPQLYLSSDLENYYEKNGWRYFTQCYGPGGGEIKVYRRATKSNEPSGEGINR